MSTKLLFQLSGLIIASAIPTFTFIFNFGKISSRVDHLEKDVSDLKLDVREIRVDIKDLRKDFAGLILKITEHYKK